MMTFASVGVSAQEQSVTVLLLRPVRLSPLGYHTYLNLESPNLRICSVLIFVLA